MKDQFIIPLNGLKPGKTQFSWHAGKEFFAEFDNPDFVDADIEVAVSVEKSGSFTGIDCRLDGYVTVPCDRCLEDLRIVVDRTVKLSVKWGEEPSTSEGILAEDDEREPVYLPVDEPDMDMSQTVYDYTCLSVPMQRVHPEGGCNPATLRYLNLGDEIPEQKEEMDSPFAGLKGLLDGKI